MIGTTLPVSPLAPKVPTALVAIPGLAFYVGSTGLKYRGRDDLFLAELPPGTVAAGSFTQNQFVGAPVAWTCRASTRARALLVNAGNANVANGAAGAACVARVAEALAADLGCEPRQIWQASTGVIGEALAPEPLIETARRARQAGPVPMAAAAAACLTSDTFVKTACQTLRVGGQRVQLSGFAKGSGMIAPNLATLLAFVFTDAQLAPVRLQALHRASVDQTLNAITVDSDTSTSDMALTFATGQGPGIGPEVEDAFAAALTQVYQDLAKLVVRDGEGASKFIEVRVEGAQDAAAAKTLAFSLADSPLVKTAIAGEDANWGRLLMALGKAGVAIDPDQISLWLGGYPIVQGGERLPTYRETPVAAHLKGQDIAIRVRVGAGSGNFRVWTCDLTHGYISINADYRS